MQKERSPVDTDLLLAQSGWVRSLARSLVRDPSGAEDIAQETLLAALQAPPPDAADAHHLRAWLGRVAYNLSHLRTRRNMRRQAREQHAAKNGYQASTADTVLRSSITRTVLGAVTRLEEPYRTTVELRYFQGLSTGDIAERMGTTDNAVRKRLWRARRQLRSALEAGGSGTERHGWFQGLLPAGLLGRRAAVPGAEGSGGWAVAWGAGALAAGALVVGTLSQPRAEPLAAPAVTPAATPTTRVALAAEAPGARYALSDASPLRAVELPPAPQGPVDAPPTPAGEPDPTGLAGPPVSAPPPLAHGRVLDLTGAPLAGLALAADGTPQEVLGWSDAMGAFELALEPPLRLVVAEPGFATLRAAAIEAWNVGADALVVATPSIDVAGRVVDEHGRPLPGARVAVEAEELAFLALDAALTHTDPVERATTADADGRFALRGVASARGLSLVATAPEARASRGASVAMPTTSQRDLVLRIELGTPAPTVLRGLVTYEDGRPAAGAEVRLGTDATVADGCGAFCLEVASISPSARLFAVKEGFRQREVPHLGGLLASRQAARIDLVLVESTRRIEGRILDAAGAPCRGWVVCARVHDEDETRLAAQTTTDENGAFRLSELVARDHMVEAYDPGTLLMTRSLEPVPAGTNEVVLRLADDALRSHLAGRVTARDGTPLAHSLLAVSLPLSDGADPEAASRLFGRTTLTDELGRFHFDSVPRRHVELAVRAASGPPSFHALDPQAPDDGMCIELAVRHELRVDLGLDAPGDSFALLDDSGQPVVLEGASRAGSRRGSLLGGRSIVYTSTAEPRTLVVYSDGAEVGRVEEPALGRRQRDS